MAVSDNGSVIGCVRIKSRRKEIREVVSVVVDSRWHRRGIATALLRHVMREIPCPFWGTCPAVLVPFYEEFGAVEVTDPRRMPPFLRRRQRWFTLFLRLARRRGHLAVMVLDG